MLFFFLSAKYRHGRLLGIQIKQAQTARRLATLTRLVLCSRTEQGKHEQRALFKGGKQRLIFSVRTLNIQRR